MTNRRKNGFIALTSVSLMSAFFIVLFVGIFFASTEGVERSLNREKGIQALSLANSCAEIALHKIKKNLYYTGDEAFSIRGNVCYVEEIETYGTHGRAIRTRAEVGGKVKKIQVEVDTSRWAALDIVSWREVAEFILFEEED